MIPAPVITFFISSAMGTIAKLWSKGMDHRRQEREQALARRVQKQPWISMRMPAGGPWVRRLIVAAVLFAVFIAPFLVATLWPEVPIFYAYTEQRGRWFGGAVGPAMEHLKYIEMKGYVILPIHQHMAAAISGFYFGAGASK